MCHRIWKRGLTWLRGRTTGRYLFGRQWGTIPALSQNGDDDRHRSHPRDGPPAVAEDPPAPIHGTAPSEACLWTIPRQSSFAAARFPESSRGAPMNPPMAISKSFDWFSYRPPPSEGGYTRLLSVGAPAAFAARAAACSRPDRAARPGPRWPVQWDQRTQAKRPMAQWASTHSTRKPSLARAPPARWVLQGLDKQLGITGVAGTNGPAVTTRDGVVLGRDRTGELGAGNMGGSNAGGIPALGRMGGGSGSMPPAGMATPCGNVGVWD